MRRPLKFTNKTYTDRSDGVGRYLDEIDKIPMITLDEEVALAIKKDEGDKEAFDKLVNANLRFVVSVAKLHQHRGLALGDLINEGNIGLIKAVKKYDHTIGTKVTSFAVGWIRQSIIDAIASEGRLVRIPGNRMLEISKINKKKNTLTQELEREPSTEELEEAMDNHLTSEKIESLMAASNKPKRTDDTTDEGIPLSDLLFVTEEKQPLLQEDREVIAENALSRLTEREANIFKLYYGIKKRPHSLYEIAIITGFSYTWVRTKLIKALDKLREQLQEEEILEYI